MKNSIPKKDLNLIKRKSRTISDDVSDDLVHYSELNNGRMINGFSSTYISSAHSTLSSSLDKHSIDKSSDANDHNDGMNDNAVANSDIGQNNKKNKMENCNKEKVSDSNENKTNNYGNNNGDRSTENSANNNNKNKNNNNFSDRDEIENGEIDENGENGENDNFSPQSSSKYDGDKISTFKKVQKNGIDFLIKTVGKGKCFREKVLTQGMNIRAVLIASGHNSRER